MLSSNRFWRIIKGKFGIHVTMRPHNRLRSLFAMLCLVAVVLLYAPLGGAAWSLYTAACCTAGQCPIHGNQPSHAPAAPKQAMDCGHDMPAMTQCSMSCCQHPDRPVIAPVIFVLPAPLAVSALTNFDRFAPRSGARSAVSSIEPLSPPPRILVPAA